MGVAKSPCAFLAAEATQARIRRDCADFVRLESAVDAEHEEAIRAILAKKDLPDEYERRLRAILFARARRKM